MDVTTCSCVPDEGKDPCDPMFADWYMANDDITCDAETMSSATKQIASIGFAVAALSMMQ